jgi:DNA modification methylase
VGDSTSQDDTGKLMAGGMVDLYLVDPPYNVALTGSTGLTIQNDDMGEARVQRVSDQSIYGGLDGHQARRLVLHLPLGQRVGQLPPGQPRCRTGSTPDALLGQEQLRPGALRLSLPVESILYGWKAGEAHRWFNDRCQTNILNFDKPKRNDVHPSMKAVEMLVYLVKNSSARGDTVLDNFGGSGSTLIACEQTGRKCRMMELDPRYCDVIRRRWAEFVHGEGCDWQSLTPLAEKGGEE